MSQAANFLVLNNNSDSSDSDISEISKLPDLDLSRSLEIMPGMEGIDNQTNDDVSETRNCSISSKFCVSSRATDLIGVRTKKLVNTPAPGPEADTSTVANYGSCCQEDLSEFTEYEDFSPELDSIIAHTDFEMLRKKTNMKSSTNKVKKIRKTTELRTSTPTPTRPTTTSTPTSTEIGGQNRNRINLSTNITILSTNTNSADINLEIPLSTPDASMTSTNTIKNGGAKYMQGLGTGLFTIGQNSTVNIYVTKCVNCTRKNHCGEEKTPVIVTTSEPKPESPKIHTNITDVPNCSNSQQEAVAVAESLSLVPLSLLTSTSTCKNNSPANDVLSPSLPFSENDLIVNPVIVREATFNPYLLSNKKLVLRSTEEQNQDLLQQKIGVRPCQDILLPNSTHFVEEANYQDNLGLQNHLLSSTQTTHLNLSSLLNNISNPFSSTSNTSVKRRSRGRPPKHAKHSASSTSDTATLQVEETEFQKMCSSKALTARNNTINSKIDNHLVLKIPTSSMLKRSTFPVLQRRGRPQKRKDLSTELVELVMLPASTRSDPKEVSIQKVEGNNTNLRPRRRKFEKESDETLNKNTTEKGRKLSFCKITKRKCVSGVSDLDKTKTGLFPVEVVEEYSNLETNDQMPVLQPVCPLIDGCDIEKNLESEYYLEATETCPRITLQNYVDLFHPVVKSFMRKTKSESGETIIVKVNKLMRVCHRCEYETESSTTNKRKGKNHFLQHCEPTIFDCKICNKRYLNKCSLERHYKESNHNSISTQSIGTGIITKADVNNFTLPKLKIRVTLNLKMKKKPTTQQKRLLKHNNKKSRKDKKNHDLE